MAFQTITTAKKSLKNALIIVFSGAPLLFLGCLVSPSSQTDSTINVAPLSDTGRGMIADIQPRAFRSIASKIRPLQAKKPLQQQAFAVTRSMLEEILKSPKIPPGKGFAKIREENSELFEAVRDLLRTQTLAPMPDSAGGCPLELYELFTQNKAEGVSPFYAREYYGPRAIVSALSLEAHRQREILLAKKNLSPADHKQVAALDAVIAVIEYGFVPITPQNRPLKNQLVMTSSGTVDLQQTLAKARSLDGILYDREPILPTPHEALTQVFSKDERGLIDCMAQGSHYVATGRQDLAKGRSNTPPPWILSLCKAWFDARQSLKRFDQSLQKPSVPRVAGDVYRGIGNFPRDLLERWLTTASRGEPLFLGIDNQPEAMFTSRDASVAQSYRFSVEAEPEKYQVLLIIRQKNGVSVEKILTNSRPKTVLIHSSQKFRLVEVFQDGHTPNGVYLKLEEIE